MNNNLNNIEKYLPIGTVVLLKDATKKIMITGFMTTPVDDIEKIYDYQGCLYPEGILTSKATMMFNHDQIQQILYLGYKNEEEIEFKEKLNKAIESINELNNYKKIVENQTQINNNSENMIYEDFEI